MKSLKITNLHAGTTDGKEILHGVSLAVKPDEIHAIMGPNGGGKSTLAQVLMGHPGYTITQGKIEVNGTDVTNLPPDQRAKNGLFLGFQYPVEVAGVNFSSFLRLAINENKKAGEKKISPIAFRNQLTDQAKQLAFSQDIYNRSLNEDFSGGEKKKAEILQLALLKPDFAVLDEPDSGLDVDALKYISKTITSLNYPLGLILITHYQRILHYIKPDHVHIMIKGKIIKSGKAALAKEIEEKGYEELLS
jgi:Fe-S cluster assembly ATP-binding protein